MLACAAADIVISDRWLPLEGVGRWMTIGRDSLAETCGLELYLGGAVHGRRHAARGERASVAAAAAA